PGNVEPIGNRGEVLRRQAEPLSKFLGANPSVEVWRGLLMEVIDELLQFALLFWRAAQLQQHVLHGQVVIYVAAIVVSIDFASSGSLEYNAIPLVYSPRDDT